MANLFSHYRQHSRTGNFHTINISAFKEFLKLPKGTNGSTILAGHSFNFERRNKGVFVTIDDKNEHLLPVVTTQLTYGKRNWFICPNTNCNTRCSKLYFNRYLLCRKCVGARYTSQNGCITDAQASRIRRMRCKLWGHDYPDVENFMADCNYFLKPKGMHWKTFEREKKKILDLEQKRLRHFIPMIARLQSRRY